LVFAFNALTSICHTPGMRAGSLFYVFNIYVVCSLPQNLTGNDNILSRTK
jgi:hypothetical protein